MARVAIVIDDFGPNLEIAKRFLELPIAITFSILPHQRYSQEIAELAHANHRQVILHMPMEPQGYPKVQPGKGALLLSMSREAVQQSLNNALDATPHVTGINNHMGSRFTENAALMKTVLDDAKSDGCSSLIVIQALAAWQLPWRNRSRFPFGAVTSSSTIIPRKLPFVNR